MPRYTNRQIETMAAHMEEGTITVAGLTIPVGPSHRENTPVVVALMKLQRELDTLSRVPSSKRDGHPAQRRYIQMAADIAPLLRPFKSQ